MVNSSAFADLPDPESMAEYQLIRQILSDGGPVPAAKYVVQAFSEDPSGGVTGRRRLYIMLKGGRLGPPMSSTVEACAAALWGVADNALTGEAKHSFERTCIEASEAIGSEVLNMAFGFCKRVAEALRCEVVSLSIRTQDVSVDDGASSPSQLH